MQAQLAFQRARFMGYGTWLSRGLIVGMLLARSSIAIGEDLSPAEPLSQEAAAEVVSLDETVTEPPEEVVVSGEQPGPPLWKVYKGEHVMYVLGTHSPVPRKMTWRSREVERVIEQADEIIAPESIDPDIGFFRGLRVLPAALRARRNPDGRQLQDVIPPELYTRWSALKAQYLGNDRGVESWRPVLAGYKLYSEALKKAGLQQREDIVWPVIRKLARKHDVRIREPRIEVKVKNPRVLIDDFSAAPPERDVECFAATLDRIENDLESMKQRANAWATGDLETLLRLRNSAQQSACLDTLEQMPRLREEVEKVRERAFTEWMSAAEAALERNAVTLAVLPMWQLLDPNGRLAQFAARGYVVQAP